MTYHGGCYATEARRKAHGELWVPWDSGGLSSQAALDKLERLRHYSAQGLVGLKDYEFRAVCVHLDGSRRDIEKGDA